MTPSSSVERAVSDVRQAAFEVMATDGQQAWRLLREALKLRPGHADLLGDLAVLHLQAGRHDAAIQAASEALAADADHDDSAYALALALQASGRLQDARERYAELATGARAERFAAAQPELAAQCQARLAQIEPARPLQSVPEPAPTPATLRAADDRDRPAQASPPTLASSTLTPAPAAAVPAVEGDTVYAPKVVRPGELGTLLRECQGIEALTLDCFDTILWRHTERPVDVFHDMQNRPAFRAAGIDAAARQRGEVHARQLQFTRTGRSEVSLEQIYLAARPGLSPDMLQWLAEDELAAEIDACHAHPAAVRLLREARSRGWPVTIVSDTYLDSGRLRRLLAHALPDDALAAIGDVICSCDHGASKSQGLFKVARLRLPADPARLLHVGDNKDADVNPARALGISACHLLHDGDESQQRRRSSAALACILDPTARAARTLHTPYRAVHATHGHDGASAKAILGHSALGPLMHAFARWIDDQADCLAATRERVNLVFLMRDAHLPLQAYRELGGRHPASAAHISRFCAYAASFRGIEQVDHYLAQFGHKLALPMIARQLLLSAERTAQLTDESERSPQPRHAFLAALRQPEVMAEITAASQAYRSRLQRHLQRQCDLGPGDTIVFVDLGYAGTAQRVLGPIVSQMWGAEVCGRYLLALGGVDDSHRGLLDRSWLDDRALAALQAYIGLLETLSADDGASAVGFDDDGLPVFDELRVDPQQHAMVGSIQAECLRFVRDAEHYFRSAGRSPRTDQLRDEALGSLGRLLFMPSEPEIGQLGRFKLEINLGTGLARPLFDLDASLDGLRKDGLSYVGTAQGGGRMAIPAELRAAGIELSLALLTQMRFGSMMARNDASMRRLPVTLLVSRDGRTGTLQTDATATHDGYFSLVVLLPDVPADVALALGRDHAWLQLHSVTRVPVHGGHADDSQESDATDLLVADGVVDHGCGLVQLEHRDAMLMFPREAFTHEGRMALKVCFRPIAARTADQAPD